MTWNRNSIASNFEKKWFSSSSADQLGAQTMQTNEFDEKKKQNETHTVVAIACFACKIVNRNRKQVK